MWPSGKVSDSEPEGSRFETQFYKDPRCRWASYTLKPYAGRKHPPSVVREFGEVCQLSSSSEGHREYTDMTCCQINKQEVASPVGVVIWRLCYLPPMIVLPPSGGVGPWSGDWLLGLSIQSIAAAVIQDPGCLGRARA
ncbi:hypothetical protein AVEN_176875-1 [Araneus ventricosus]|uniref:Uncharacterized protein n=1 Tax=Araneus ventricosus TaxID=182803 RepID=A0A4Y2WBK0_ARAVE|nr:hypothetical protein AVEN_262840-1 [Araneus ventricosus]GBO33918.1 hypothetical protein AVEN_142698-1 [Araneus ventricosus]GBO33928.1 hypothetical protein AVEN_176875-1 [Araneus ventricosus]